MNWRFFSRQEFACRCGCNGNLQADDFIAKLDALRAEVGFPLPVSSGYRCPDHNARVSTTGRTGPHTTGRAVDLAVDRTRAHTVLAAALRAGFTGIGVQQKGATRFIHLDDLASGRPTVWSY